MIDHTLFRLQTTCFGAEDDGVGECFYMSLIVLRFLAVAASEDTEWIKGRIQNYCKHSEEKKRPWFSRWYFWLCLSELPPETALPEIDKYKDEMLLWLSRRSCVMNSEHDKTIHPLLMFLLRNNIRRYLEYDYISSRQPYVDEKDGRLHFDLSRA
jgi:hypothetical protein